VNDDNDIPIIEAKASDGKMLLEGYLQGGGLWLPFYNMKSLIAMCAANISVGVFQFHSFLHVKGLTNTTLLPSLDLISRAFFPAHGLWLCM
jgi:hypothetical protein